MKKTGFMLFIFILLLTACDTENFKDPLLCNDNQILVDGICINNEEQPSTCEEGLIRVGESCIDPNNMSDEDSYELLTNAMMSLYDDAKEMTVSSSLEIYILDQSNHPLEEIELQHTIRYDQTNKYYYEMLNNIHTDYARENRTIQTFDGVIIDTEESTLRHFEIEDLHFSLSNTAQASDHASYVDSNTQMTNPSMDINAFDTITKTDDLSFTVMAPLSILDHITSAFDTATSNLSISSLYQELFEFELTFSENQNALEIAFNETLRPVNIDGEDVKVNINLSINLRIGAEDLQHPFNGNLTFQLPESKEDVTFTNPVYFDELKKEYYVTQQGGWAHYQLEAGFYKQHVSGNHSLVTYTFYDDQGNVIELGDVFELTEPTDLYLHIQSPVSQEIIVTMEKTNITDLTIEYDLPIEHGTISGTFEGDGDQSIYMFTDDAPYEGYIVIDASTISSNDQYFILAFDDLLGCNLTGDDYCYIQFNQGDDLTITLMGNYLGDFTFDYSYHEKESNTTDLSLMNNILTYDQTNPLYITTDGLSVFLNVTESNQDVALNKIVTGTSTYHYQIDIYTINNVLIVSDWNGYTPLNPGQYIIKFSAENGYIFLVPELLFHQR